MNSSNNENQQSTFSSAIYSAAHANWTVAKLLSTVYRKGVGARRKNLIIFPSDPQTIVGALGDDAMITATADRFRLIEPDAEIHVLCDAAAQDIVRSLGHTPVILPYKRRRDLALFPLKMCRLLQKGHYAAFAALGADIMDGYYNIEVPLMMLVSADIATKQGLSSTILGCSFNNQPAPELRSFYNRVDKKAALNARDELSYARLTAFSKKVPRLVADSAFTLKPGTADAAASEWIKVRKEADRIVVGINVHPMLIKNASPEQVECIVASMIQAIIHTSRNEPCSWLLLPHDYRPSIGDEACLQAIYHRLSVEGIDCYYFPGKRRASELKAIASRLDGVITGRMHLAIAALGMNVPTLSLTYQEKFEGLYKHFNLPVSLLLSPSIFDTPSKLSDSILEFVRNLGTHAATISTHLQQVLNLSEKNFNTDTAN